MAYTPSTWADGEAGGTPITASALNKIENGIADATETAEAPIEAGDIPTLAISKISGLQGALDGKQPAGDYATVSALEALELRVAALENPEA